MTLGSPVPRSAEPSGQIAPVAADTLRRAQQPAAQRAAVTPQQDGQRVANNADEQLSLWSTGSCAQGRRRTAVDHPDSVAGCRDVGATVRSMSPSADDRPVSLDPIGGVLQILDRARMSGTHKLGLLLTLLDLIPSLEEGSEFLPMTDIAERYFEIHWQHGRPYPVKGDRSKRVPLLQKSGSGGDTDVDGSDDIVVMQKVRELRGLLEDNDRTDLVDLPLNTVRRRIEGTELDAEWRAALKQALSSVNTNL